MTAQLDQLLQGELPATLSLEVYNMVGRQRPRKHTATINAPGNWEATHNVWIGPVVIAEHYGITDLCDRLQPGSRQKKSIEMWSVRVKLRGGNGQKLKHE